jgi:hypothetical protein
MLNFTESNNLYKKISPELGINLYKFDGLDIPFNPLWKKIGINLSGGADSACLMMLLGKIIVENNIDCEVHIITHHRCWNVRPWQSSIANNVFNKLEEKFPTIKFVKHKNYIPPELEWGVLGPITKDPFGRDRSGDQIIVASFNEYTMYNEQLDAMYNGTSRNPDVDFPHKMENREKPPEKGILKDLMFKKQKGHVFLPFKFVRKDWIVAQYYRHGMVDLYETTRSCEGNIGHLTSKDIIPTLADYKPGMYVPICNECFWCLERSWAESKLNETLKNLDE